MQKYSYLKPQKSWKGNCPSHMQCNKTETSVTQNILQLDSLNVARQKPTLDQFDSNSW